MDSVWQHLRRVRLILRTISAYLLIS